MPLNLTAAPDILDDAWARLAEGAADARHPFRNAALATAGPDVRTVVLRQAYRAGHFIDFHTDRRSPKVNVIAVDPRVAFVFWHPADRVQLRLTADAVLHSTDADADAAWAALGEHTRGQYRTPLTPGTVLDALPLKAPDPAGDGRANFMLVRCAVVTLEWLHLHPDGHRRARYTGDGSMVEWLAP